MTDATLYLLASFTVHVAAYLLAAFALLGVIAARDRFVDVRVAFWLSLCWPLTLAAVLTMLIGRVLRALGFRFLHGQPREGIRWRAGWVEPKSRNHLGPRRRGFWLACPWRVVAFWWVRS